METSLKWTLPPGFTASEISWPFPEKTFMSQYPCHGYERDVTLLVTITPPTTIPDSSVTLSAEAAWMCCAKGCFPGFQTVKITLPVAEVAVKNPEASALIKKSLGEIPKATHALKCTLLSAPEASMIQMQIEGLKKQSLTNFYFFSSDRQVSSDQTQTVTRNAEGAVILSVPRSEYSPKGHTTLPGILSTGSENFAIEAAPAKK